MASNESFYFRSAECILVNPDNLGRVATLAGEFNKIGIRCHDREAVRYCVFPNPHIRRESLQPGINDVRGAWE